MAVHVVEGVEQRPRALQRRHRPGVVQRRGKPAGVGHRRGQLGEQRGLRGDAVGGMAGSGCRGWCSASFCSARSMSAVA